eukprot:358560-Chlamydomonas_euryale.AAC.1
MPSERPASSRSGTTMKYEASSCGARARAGGGGGLRAHGMCDMCGMCGHDEGGGQQLRGARARIQTRRWWCVWRMWRVCGPDCCVPLAQRREDKIGYEQLGGVHAGGREGAGACCVWDVWHAWRVCGLWTAPGR